MEKVLALSYLLISSSYQPKWDTRLTWAVLRAQICSGVFQQHEAKQDHMSRMSVKRKMERDQISSTQTGASVLMYLEINIRERESLSPKFCWHVSQPIQINMKTVHLEMKTKFLYSRGMKLSNHGFAEVMESRKGISTTFKRNYLNLKWNYTWKCRETNKITLYVMTS